ncbi:putative leucine-rich repeat-containing protein DDB_G0290503 [Chironomus tepperi]|uniref:putative leucine-rich repeat-containing protein DDB_G0290503 n=1 Tax=Chironomus tepperi TaxID=113505 RepID=UPI00391F9E30
MKQLECQIFRKTRKLVRRKHATIQEFQNLLLEDEYLSLIAAIEEQEEDLNDVLIFSEGENHKFYQISVYKEIDDLEDFKKRVVNNYEYKIIKYGELSQEEAVLELEEFIEASKDLVDEYYENFNNSINRLLRKLTVIKHILKVQNQAKRVNFNFLTIQKNLKNLSNLITVDNAQTILISNIEKLENSAEEKFQNLLQLIGKLGKSSMEPCYPENINAQCPSISESSGSSDDDDIYYFADPKLNEKRESEEQSKTSDCFFVDRSSGGTRMDSIERLKTDVSQLQGELESIQERKAKISERIELKKNEILEALAKIAELEDNLREIETLIADQLFNFQDRIINLESKLMENYKTGNDSDLKNLLENEILDIKESFHAQFEKDEKNLSDLTKSAQTFAASIGDIISDIHRIFDATKINEKLTSDIEKMKKLISRPGQFCFDSKGRRFFFNNDRLKVFQDEFHTAQFIINSDGDEVIVKEALPIETDTNGEFYFDVKHRKIYIKYFFEDDYGHYYIDVHGDRHYKTDAQASEYMLVNGIWVKTAEGTYERDEKGMRIKPAEDPIEAIEEESDAEVHDLENDETAPTQKHKMSKDDLKYIKETVGPAIIKACAATYLHKPSDPLSYFANFLLHYRYTEKMFEARDKELNYFIELRKQIEKECGEKKG